MTTVKQAPVEPPVEVKPKRATKKAAAKATAAKSAAPKATAAKAAPKLRAKKAAESTETLRVVESANQPARKRGAKKAPEASPAEPVVVPEAGARPTRRRAKSA